MTQDQAKIRLAQLGAVLTNNHFVYTSGRHGSVYVAKDMISPHPTDICAFGKAIAQKFLGQGIGVIAGPAVASIPLVQWTAHWLGKLDGNEVLAVYAEREKSAIPREPKFALGRGYDKLAKGRRVLVVDDILTTGGSAESVVEAVRAAGGYPLRLRQSATAAA